MANIHSFSQSSKEHSKKRRRASEVDNEQKIPSWSAPYERRIRDLYQLRSRADAYKNVAIHPKYTTFNGDYSDHIPPNVLPAELDFTILSADLICKYWAIKNNSLLQFKEFRIALKNYNVPSTYLALMMGSIATYAATGMINAATVAVANKLYDLPFSSTWIEPVGQIANFIKTSKFVTGGLLSSVMTASGLVTRQFTENYVDNILKERTAKRRRKDVVDEFMNETNEALLETDPTLLNLRGQCVNIYSMLCESRNLPKCKHPEPYKCRKAYMDSFGDNTMIIKDYLDLPNKIIGLHKDYPFLDEEKFSDKLTETFRTWKYVLNNLPGSDGEVGLILSTIYYVVQDPNHRAAIASHVRGLFTSLFLIDKQDNTTKYTKAIRSCLLTMLISQDNFLIEYIKLCIYPKTNDVNRYAKTDLIERIWQDIELLLDNIDIDLNIRHQKRYDLSKSDATFPESSEIETGSLPSPVIETPENIIQARALDDQLQREYSGMNSRPVQIYVNYLQKYLEEIDIDIWTLALRERLKKMGNRIDLKNVAHPLMEFVIQRYKSFIMDNLDKKQMASAFYFYNMVKATLLDIHPKLSNAVWTKSYDMRLFNSLRATLNKGQDTEEQLNFAIKQMEQMTI